MSKIQDKINNYMDQIQIIMESNTHLEKDHPMLRATFVVLQDDKVHLDTGAGVGFLRYMFCTHTSSSIPSLLVSLMQLPSCS